MLLRRRRVYEDVPVESLVNVLAAALAIVAGTWGFLHWWMRPRFVVGITPSERDEIALNEVGRTSVARQFIHKPDCFAARFRDKAALTLSDKRTLLEDSLRSRRIGVDPDSRARIPVLIANLGKRETDVSLSVHLLPSGVHLVDVDTEAMDVWVYAHNGAVLEMHDDVEETIRDAYDAYMRFDQKGDWGDVVYIAGTLESGLFELSVLTVACEPDVDAVFAVFTINCSDRWLGVKTYIQGCTLVRA